MYGDLGNALTGAFYVLMAILALSVPLAIWKLVDICIWLYQHVSIGINV